MDINTIKNLENIEKLISEHQQQISNLQIQKSNARVEFERAIQKENTNYVMYSLFGYFKNVEEIDLRIEKTYKDLNALLYNATQYYKEENKKYRM